MVMLGVLLITCLLLNTSSHIYHVVNPTRIEIIPSSAHMGSYEEFFYQR